MSNFRLLVHPLLIDFGGGSCSSCCCSCSCCCCDRGKTKSTPSPKTEVWTLDWSLPIFYFTPLLCRMTSSCRLKAHPSNFEGFLIVCRISYFQKLDYTKVFFSVGLTVKSRCSTNAVLLCVRQFKSSHKKT